jgi:hypothetical protein
MADGASFFNGLFSSRNAFEHAHPAIHGVPLENGNECGLKHVIQKHHFVMGESRGPESCGGSALHRIAATRLAAWEIAFGPGILV